jgi:hypothetical protein
MLQNFIDSLNNQIEPMLPYVDASNSFNNKMKLMLHDLFSKKT